jgi:hypothetical protein
MSGDHAGDFGFVLDRCANLHAHVTVGSEPAAARSVIDVDRHRPDLEQVTRFPDPWELLFGRPTEPAEEDL